MERSNRFYTDGLGWKVGVLRSARRFDGRILRPRGAGRIRWLSPDDNGSGFSGVVFTYVVRSEARVDEVLEEAKKAGARILKAATKEQWGGYGGAFADPDGYVWQIGYSAQGKNQPYAE